MFGCEYVAYTSGEGGAGQGMQSHALNLSILCYTS